MPMEARLLDAWHGEGRPEVVSLPFLVLLSFLPLSPRRRCKKTPLS